MLTVACGRAYILILINKTEAVGVYYRHCSAVWGIDVYAHSENM